VAQPGQTDHPPLDVQAAGDRIEALLTASASGGAIARERAEELVRTVADLYGAGLERVLDILHEMGRLDDDVLGRLAADSTVSSLLLVHGLHPYDITTRVEKALESVRPYLGSHGGDVELLDVSDEGVVRLRLLGSCDGCPSSSVTLTLAVERAVEAAAPEVTSIEVETAADEAPAKPGSLISIDSLRSRITEPAAVHGASWEVVPELSELAAGSVTNCAVAGTPILACRVGSELYAFRDLCPRCENALSGAQVSRRLGGAAEDAVLVCPTCRGHYDVRHAGASLDEQGLHLDPLPLLQNGGEVCVAVPTTVTA
jgi:Fe-S cluster biogenesis protein NfuA/nitrite reductase/ring-hydroxylating ferredoxin subunit